MYRESKSSQCYFRLIDKPLILCYARSGHRGLLDLRSDFFGTTTTTTTTATIYDRCKLHRLSLSSTELPQGSSTEHILRTGAELK